MTQQTFGQKAVGLKFNPSGDDTISLIKQDFASAIDRLQVLRCETLCAEEKRMYSIAITEAQTAQMWAVKAATWKF